MFFGNHGRQYILHQCLAKEANYIEESKKLERGYEFEKYI
jgi:hypothetical protein